MSDLNLNGALGTTVIGSWAATALCTLELTWAVQYYSNSSKQDSLYFRILVAVTLLIDLAGLFGAQADVYMFCVLHWGDYEYLQHQYWTVPFCFTTGIITDAIVQGFLIMRYMRLSKNWYIGSVLTILAVVTLGSGLSVVILSLKWSEVEQRLLLAIPIKLWLSLDVVSNICISLALIYKFVGERNGLKTTRIIIRRLIILSLQSAIIPAFCAISALVAYLSRPDTNISAIFLWLLPRAYVLTMLYALNIRGSIQQDIKPESGGGATDFTIREIRAIRSGQSGQSLTTTMQLQVSSVLPPTSTKQDDYSLVEMNTSNNKPPVPVITDLSA